MQGALAARRQNIATFHQILGKSSGHGQEMMARRRIYCCAGEGEFGFACTHVGGMLPEGQEGVNRQFVPPSLRNSRLTPPRWFGDTPARNSKWAFSCDKLASKRASRNKIWRIAPSRESRPFRGWRLMPTTHDSPPSNASRAPWAKTWSSNWWKPDGPLPSRFAGPAYPSKRFSASPKPTAGLCGPHAHYDGGCLMAQMGIKELMARGPSCPL